MSYHVVIPDSIDQAAIDLLAGVEGLTYAALGKVAREELLTLAPQADAFVIRSGVKIDGEVLGAAARLKCVARAGVGVDMIWVACALLGLLLAAGILRRLTRSSP